MSLENVIRNRNSLITTIGKNALNVKYPKEFELYICALELVDEDFNTLRYFVFPIMPSSIEEIKPELTNIKKTLAGVTALSTPTFVPTDITLVGNFGKKFKVLLGTDYVDLVSSFVDNGVGNGLRELFDERIKTGYGCIKILEEIIEQSNSIGADGRLRKLILHNPALGNSYIVKASNIRLHQNEQTNMIWNYSLPLKSLAPLESLLLPESMESVGKRLNITAYVQKKVDKVVNGITALIAKTETKITR